MRQRRCALTSRPMAEDGNADKPDETAEPSLEGRSLRMATDRILALPSPELAERKSRAGILIPATADLGRSLTWAEVVIVGPTVRNVEPKDRILFAPENSFEVALKGEDYVIVRERDLHAIASRRTDGETGLYL